jgi:hypothetical protein
MSRRQASKSRVDGQEPRSCVARYAASAERAETFVRLAAAEWRAGTEADRARISRTLIDQLGSICTCFEALEPQVVARHLDHYCERRTNGPRGGTYKIRVLALRLAQECHDYGLVLRRRDAREPNITRVRRTIGEYVGWPQPSVLRREALLLEVCAGRRFASCSV